jgi:uncharacterized Zn finger protein
MTVLTDSWARRLKTCLEHATRSPIIIEVAMQRLSLARLNTHSIFGLLIQNGYLRSPPGNVRVAPGVITMQSGGVSVEIHVPVFTPAERDAIVGVVAMKMMYALLLDAWNDGSKSASGYPLSISTAERNSTKNSLDLDLIDRGIHVIPRSPDSFQILCDCSKSANVHEQLPGRQEPYCNHVLQSLPEIVAILDSDPGKFLLLRGMHVKDLKDQVDAHVVHMYATKASTRTNDDQESTPKKVETSCAWTKDMLECFWSYPASHPNVAIAGSSGIEIPIMEKNPMEAAPSSQLDYGMTRSPPARILSILSSIYDQVRSRDGDYNQILAGLSHRKK